MSIGLHIVEYPNKTQYAEAYSVNPEYDFSKMAICPKCGRNVSGGYWAQPRSVVLTKRKTPDFLYIYGGNIPFLISQSALEKMTDAELTGIVNAQQIENVRFQRKSTQEISIPTYYQIELARSCITIDHKSSVISYGTVRSNSAYSVPCTLCHQMVGTYDFFRSLVLDTSEYEGYDIFQTYELGNTVLLSQRFVDFYKESGLTNLFFETAKSHGRSISTFFLNEGKSSF